MISRDERTPLSQWWWTVDRPLLGAIIALMLSGVILSLAASPPVATRIGLDPFHFFNHHVLFLVPALFVLLGVSFMSPRQIRRSALIVFALSVVLIVATLLTVFRPGAFQSATGSVVWMGRSANIGYTSFESGH